MSSSNLAKDNFKHLWNKGLFHQFLWQRCNGFQCCNFTSEEYCSQYCFIVNRCFSRTFCLNGKRFMGRCNNLLYPHREDDNYSGAYCIDCLNQAGLLGPSEYLLDHEGEAHDFVRMTLNN